MMREPELPLEGLLVLDVSRLLPGGVLARQLLDLGARVIKVEEPGTGDAMRMVPPIVDGMGIGFQTLLRGAESVCLDLSRPEDQARFQRLAARADVLVESFRPGTMAGWDLGFEALEAANPRLIWCSLAAFGRTEAVRDRVAHDLNLVALSGALTAMGPEHHRIQLADVGAGLLAASSILAALLRRAGTGRGGRVDQPLISGALPFMTWRWAEVAAGREEVVDLLLGGAFPCYRTYLCGDQKRVAVSVLEPKFWIGFVTMLGAEELDRSAFAMGEEGRSAVARIEEILAEHPGGHWLAKAEMRGLPVSAVHAVEEAVDDPVFREAGLLEELPLSGGEKQTGIGPWLTDIGETPLRRAPTLGEHTEAVLEELR